LKNLVSVKWTAPATAGDVKIQWVDVDFCLWLFLKFRCF
jgi:hypothetical protein